MYVPISYGENIWERKFEKKLADFNFLKNGR